MKSMERFTRASGLLLGGGLIVLMVGCQNSYHDQWLDDSSPMSLDEVVPRVAPQQTVPQPVVEAPVVSIEPQPAPIQTYTIRRGDTLWSIAQRSYGDGKRWREIVAANKGLDPTRLRVGQQIVLP